MKSRGSSISGVRFIEIDLTPRFSGSSINITTLMTSAKTKHLIKIFIKSFDFCFMIYRTKQYRDFTKISLKTERDNYLKPRFRLKPSESRNNSA